MKVHEAAERARAWIARHGDETARLRAEALLGRADPAQVVARLAPGADTASLRAALEVCDDLRALADPRVEDWVAAASAAQAADGGFAAGLPLDERLFETGMLAGHLAKTRSARPATLAAAAGFLARHWSPERVRGGSWRAIAAYAHFYANAGPDAADADEAAAADADAVLQWCGRELARGWLTRRFDAVRTARVLVYCDAHTLPGSSLRAPELVEALAGEQRADGGFPAREGEGARDALGSTLDALVALCRLT